VLDPRLQRSIDELGDRWTAFALDAADHLAWVSRELKEFLGEHDDERLRVGEHILAAMLSEAWRAAITPESGVELFSTILRYLVGEGSSPDELAAILTDDVAALARSAVPEPAPPLWAGRFDYIQKGYAPNRIEYVVTSLRGEDGELIGRVFLSNLGLPPTLMARLGRGDQAMYERMARIAEPRRQATAILFADLQASAELSRTLPTAVYFQLIRRLTSAFDTLVAAHAGIVGKHVGDGFTAFVLAAEAGGPSQAVEAAVSIARELQSRATELVAAMELPAGLRLRVNAAVHWGAGVFLGQLVPDGRLDVTALGDEVNECARVAECARGGTLLVTKAALELLDGDALRRLDVDAERVTYSPLVSMDGATEKTRRDAALLAVTAIGTGAG
jgi:class 3 adenylate cyclase